MNTLLAEVRAYLATAPTNNYAATRLLERCADEITRLATTDADARYFAWEVDVLRTALRRASPAHALVPIADLAQRYGIAPLAVGETPT